MILWRQLLVAALIVSPAVLLLAGAALWELLKPTKGNKP